MKVRRIDFYPDDWIAGTLMLSHQERSIYISICASIWSQGSDDGGVDINYVRQICQNGHNRHFERGLEGLVEKGKIVLERTKTGLRAYQERAKRELRRAQERTTTSLRNGAKGGRPNGLAKPDGFENQKPNNQQPSTNIEDSEADASGAAPPQTPPVDPVKVLWDSAVELLEGAHVKNPRPLIGKWRREYGDVAVMAAVNQAAADTVSEPIGFIVKTLARTGANGHGRRQSPVEKQFEGFARAIAKLEAADRSTHSPTLVPLLDS